MTNIQPDIKTTRYPIWLLLWPLAIIFRLSNIFGVFVDGKVFLCGTDPYYHLRRIILTLNNFPHVPDKDPFLNFPFGAPTHWPYGFDIIMAGIISCLTLGQPERWWTEAIGALLPPFIGGLLPLVIYLIVLEFSDQFTALFAGLLTAILPVAIFFSQIGNLDHHFLAAFCQGLFWLTYLRASQHQEKSNLWAVLSGIVLLIGFTSTTEFPFVIGIHCVYLFLVWFITNNERRNQLILINLKIFGSTTLLLLPCIFTKYFEPNGVSPLLASSWFGCFVFTTFLSIFACIKKLIPLKFLGIILLLALIFASKFDYSLITALINEANQSQGNNILGASIRENRTLIFDGLGYLNYWHSGFLFLAPLTIFLLIKRRSEVNLLILVGLVIMLTLSLAHMRLGVLLPVPFVLASALTTKEIFLFAKGYFSTNRLGELLATLFIFLLIFSPISSLNFSNSAIVVSHKPFLPLYNSFFWLNQHSPKIDPHNPSYGVLANEWDLGHWLIYFSERPTVSSPLLHTSELAQAVFQSTKIFVQPPAKAIESLDKYKLRYLFFTPDDFLYLLELAGEKPPAQGQTIDSLYGRLLASYAFPGGSVNHPTLNRIRLVYESPEKSEGDPPLPSIMIFEVVKGAHLVGLTQPNEVVTLNTQIRTAKNHQIPYSVSTKADETGSFEFVVPYSTNTDSSTNVFVTPYLVKSDNFITSAKVTSTQVRNGESIQVSTTSSKK